MKTIAARMYGPHDLRVEEIELPEGVKILMGGDVFQRTLAEKAPNYLCEDAYQLANSFSKFYHDNRIIDEPDEAKKQSWLALISLVRQVLCNHLDLLGIETVEHM